MSAVVRRPLLIGLLLLGLFWSSSGPLLAGNSSQVEDSERRVAQEPPAPPQPLAGKQSYQENCAPCHGETGGGDGPTAGSLGFTPTALSDREAIAGLSPAQWIDVTLNGRMDRMMPPWGKRLSDEQIWDTVGYAWTLHTSKEEVDRGKAVYARECASCHGEDGKGAPGVAGVPDFTDFPASSQASPAAWAELLAAGRGKMLAFGEALSEAEQLAVLEYVRSLGLGPMFRGALAAGDGVISGVVTNQTTGQPVGGQTVDLGIFDGSSLLEERSATSDPSGHYRFEGLPADPTLLYAIRTEYPAGVPYSPDPVSLNPDQAVTDVPISVYETTSDSSGIVADRVHYIVELQPGVALIAELVVLSNQGDRTYVGDDSGGLRFTVPAGAQELDISDGQLGERFQLTEDGFVDRQPIPPGRAVRQLIYRYSLPYSGSALELTRSLAFPAANVNALIVDVGQQVTSDELVNQGTRATDTGSFIDLQGQNLGAGQAVTIQMKNLPSEAGGAGSGGVPAGATSQRVLIYTLVGLAAAAAVLLAAWPLLRRRATSRVSFSAVSDRTAIVDELARLAVAHDNGDIPEAAYRLQRLRLKAALLDLERPLEPDTHGR